jgi:solute carrier family 24 (sodium/potassium/calcium exchanger), member 6
MLLILDILLGVGVSGLIMSLSTKEEYHVSISPTLLVSTISLFVTLTSMLIVVPLSEWRMTRVFGICLVVFFTLSTAASVLVEIFT